MMRRAEKSGRPFALETYTTIDMQPYARAFIFSIFPTPGAGDFLR
jgi:hypothetical protein